MEIAGGLLYVFADLGSERFDRRELDFVTQAVEEVNFDFGIRTEFDWVKIQQVGLNRERVRAEGRPGADVGDGIEALFTNPGAGDVNAILGNELFVAT